MNTISRRNLLRGTGLFLVGLLGFSCSDGGTGPKKELAPLVGTWNGQVVLLTNQSNPSQSVDIIAEGATFSISILATGTYTAHVSFFGNPAPPEIGTVTVSGNQITIAPTGGTEPPTTGTWAIQGGVLTVDGETEFDFNLDGTREAATVHMELTKVNS